jgi:hypothetical protein
MYENEKNLSILATVVAIGIIAGEVIWIANQPVFSGGLFYKWS